MSEQKRPPPRNHLSREERLERWEAAALEGAKLCPSPITGDERTRYLWLQLISLSSLPALTRLMAHSLALFGDAKGQSRNGSVDGVFPSIRELSKRSGLSERSTCTHAEALVRTAWLQRSRYRVRLEQGAWEGTLYRFCVPWAVVRDPANSSIIVPKWEREGVEPAAAPRSAGAASAATPARSELHAAAASGAGAESAAKGVERDDVEVLKELPEGVEPDDGRVLNAVQSRFSSEALRRGSHLEVQTECAYARRANAVDTKKDPEERLRKALKHLEADPNADVCKLYRVTPEELRQRMSA